MAIAIDRKSLFLGATAINLDDFRPVLPGTDRSAMDGAYVETFSDGPGGWSAWGYVEDEGAVVQSGNPGTGPISIPLVDGCLRSSSPWWCDFLTAWRLRV